MAETLDVFDRHGKRDSHCGVATESRSSSGYVHRTDTMTDEVVQLHLEHAIVRRLLGRFTAQGFVHTTCRVRASVKQLMPFAGWF